MSEVKLPTDIAVVRQRYGKGWRVLAYVGPERTTTIINIFQLYGGASIKIEYLNEGEQ